MRNTLAVILVFLGAAFFLVGFHAMTLGIAHGIGLLLAIVGLATVQRGAPFSRLFNLTVALFLIIVLAEWFQ